MPSIKKELDVKSVMGIIVAENFDKKIGLVVTKVNNVSLIKYKMRFDFEKAG
jgi:hypothetical protein